MGVFSNYNIGGDGVNLVKNPLELADGEALQLQNAEMVPDQSRGGLAALSKRGGFAVLNSSALAGSVIGGIGLNLKTTYTRTLYAGRGTETANTWRTSTNGTTWANVATPIVAADIDKFTDANGTRDARRMASLRNLIVYPGNAYTKGTNNPPLVIWDGTENFTVAEIPVGPSATANTPAFSIVDAIVVNGKLYLAIHDPGGAAPDLAGRVMRVDLLSGKIDQIASAFGNGTGEKTGGYPCCLAWYQNQLFVGLQGNTTTDGIGQVVRCFPDIDTAWTADVSNLSGFPCSLMSAFGDLFVGTESSVSTGAKIYRRAASTKAYTAVFTSGGGAGGTGFCTSLIEYSGSLYAVEYFATTPIIHIKISADGTTWTTDRDVDATDSGVATNYPGNAVLGPNSDLLISFRATTASAADGFILRKASGTWTKVDAAQNLNGNLSVLVQRS
jgi:hypothetical protein